MNQQPIDNLTLVEQEFIRSLRTFAQLAHENSRNKGFWNLIEELRNHPRKDELEIVWKLSRVALIQSEASEALEGIRKNLTDDHLPHRSMEAAELADVIIRILDYAGAYDLPLGEVILEKMLYNSNRPYMHGKKA